MFVRLSDGWHVKQRFLSSKLQQLTQNRKVVLQWIPAHGGIADNEKADKLAKQGTKGEQSTNIISHTEKVIITKALTRLTPSKGDYHLLDRPAQVTIFRMRTGHNRLNAHMPHNHRLLSSPKCSCGQEDQTTEPKLSRIQLLTFLI